MAVTAFADFIDDVADFHHCRLRFARGNVRAGTGPATQNALGSEIPQCAVHGHAGCPESYRQLALGRHTVSFWPCAGFDLSDNELLDSLAERSMCAETPWQLKVAFFFRQRDGSRHLRSVGNCIRS